MSTDEKYRAAATKLYHREGEVEIDKNADISESDDGAYVQAWVWVSDQDAEIEK